MSEILAIDNRVKIVESKQADQNDRLNKVENQLQSLVQSVSEIKIIIASARGSIITIMFLAPFFFAGLSFICQAAFQKLFG